MVELRLDSPDGKLIVSSNCIIQKNEPRRRWGEDNSKLTPEEKKKKRREHKQVLTLSLDT